MTPAEVLARHTPYTESGDFMHNERCEGCETADFYVAWPCNAVEMARQLQAADARIAKLETLLAEGAEYGEWTHAHCDEDSGGVRRFDLEWWKADAKAALFDTLIDKPL